MTMHDTKSWQTSLIVIQSTPFCNINCRYCYLPERSNKAMMSPETIREVFSKIFRSGLVRDEVTVVWHAGEPMVLPPRYYDNAFSIIRSLTPAGVRVVQSFQTNATLINEAWCELIKRWDVQVGVSLDGPKPVHDANRVTRSGAGTFDRVMAGIAMLERHDINFSVISVVSQTSLPAADELYEFFASNRIRTVAINVEEIDGVNRKSFIGGPDAESSYYAFSRQFWGMAFTDKRVAFLREVENTFRSILRPVDDPIRNDQVSPFAILCVDRDANYTTFSPEFIGLKSDRYQDFVLGNLWRDEVLDCVGREPFEGLYRDIRSGVDRCRRECGYFSVCGGGAPANKLAENGSLDSSETAFCRLSVKCLTDVALGMMEADVAMAA